MAILEFYPHAHKTLSLSQILHTRIFHMIRQECVISCSALVSFPLSSPSLKSVLYGVLVAVIQAPLPFSSE